MIEFIGLDVVVYALQALVTLQEFIRLIRIVQVGEILPFDVESLYKVRSVRCGEETEPRQAHNILVEFVLEVALLALVASVGQNLLDFVLLRILRHSLGVVVSGVGFLLECFEVFDIVDIIWDLATSGGHPNFIGRTNSLLLLGSRAII